MPSFKMLVKSGDNPSLYDEKLVSKINGLPKAGYVFVIYARLANPDHLGQADTLERRERRILTTEEDEGGSCVSVYLNKVNDAGYFMTTKLVHPNATTIEQVHVPLSETSYSHLARISYCNMPFERFKFPCANSDLVWEIDVFKGADGNHHPWVKLELEVADLDDPIPPFPIPCEEYFLDFPGIVTAKQKEFIKQLWLREWLSLDTDWIRRRHDFVDGTIVGTP